MNNDEPLFDGFDEEPDLDYELENDLLLMKLRAEFGGEPQFFPISADGEQLPAEVRYEILQNIYSFEQAYQDPLREVVTIEQLLGRPYYLPETHLTDAGINAELGRLNAMLQENRIHLDMLYPTASRDLYRFITRELMSQPIEPCFPKGMSIHFLYEEFIPNHYKELERKSMDIIRKLMAGELLFELDLLNDEIVCGDEVMPEPEAVRRFQAFNSLFRKLEILDLRIQDIDLEDEQARVDFYLMYRATLETGEDMERKGTGSVGFIKKNDVWLADAIDLPGMEL